MKKRFAGVPAIAGVVCSFAIWSLMGQRKNDYPVAPVPYKDVQITDAFWTPRLDNNRKVSIPGMLDRYEQMGRNPDLRLVEGACYELAEHPDPELRSRIDSKLDALIAAIRAHKRVWSSAGDGQLLNAGNFMETAVAYQEATGSRKLLDVAIEIANDIDAVFGPDKRHDISNHEGIKLGLVRLYRATGDVKYLKLAKFFLDTRGNPARRTHLYGAYAQDQEPVKAQTRAIGHCVRATYLYAPLTDIAVLTGDSAYVQASQRIWQDAVSKRTYLTGGVGTYRDEEDYGDDYDLPNLSCWNEICAAFGNTLWNERLFLLTQDARYIDVLERTLYNGLLAGVSLAGDTYLYQAPLEAYAGFARQKWFGPNCCPPNLARLLPQLGSFVYAQGDSGLYVNLFVASTAKAKVKGFNVAVAQETKYPWEGVVKLTLDPQAVTRFPVLVRIPGWAREEPMPELLYHYLPSQAPAFTLKVNGAAATFGRERGYAKIDREWKAGDTIELNFPMPVEKVVARDEVADDRGLVALERGPLVYCVEKTDNPGGVFNLAAPDDARFQFAYRPDLLGGMGTITGNSLTAIPYFAFGNRGSADMEVWLARDPAKARVAPTPTPASAAKATSSVGTGTVAENYPRHTPPTPEQRWYPNSQDGSGDIRAIQESREPVNSEDGSGPYLRLRPQTGDAAWVQYDFAKPAKVSAVEVYWKDDKQYCVLPKGWRLLYKEGAAWQPVRASGPFGVEKDKFNHVAFEPVTTTALRIEIQLQPKVYKRGDLGPPDANYLRQDLTWHEGGVIQWRVM